MWIAYDYELQREINLLESEEEQKGRKDKVLKERKCVGQLNRKSMSETMPRETLTEWQVV